LAKFPHLNHYERGEIIVLEVKRRKGESFEGLLRRFGRRIQQSGKLLEARKFRFHNAKPNKNAIRESALRRDKIRQKREYLIKVGKMVEERPRRSPR